VRDEVLGFREMEKKQLKEIKKQFLMKKNNITLICFVLIFFSQSIFFII
jgi:hypothetical protein